MIPAQIKRTKGIKKMTYKTTIKPQEWEGAANRLRKAAAYLEKHARTEEHHRKHGRSRMLNVLTERIVDLRDKNLKVGRGE